MIKILCFHISEGFPVEKKSLFKWSAQIPAVSTWVNSSSYESFSTFEALLTVMTLCNVFLYVNILFFDYSH